MALVLMSQYLELMARYFFLLFFIFSSINGLKNTSTSPNPKNYGPALSCNFIGQLPYHERSVFCLCILHIDQIRNTEWGLSQPARRTF